MPREKKQQEDSFGQQRDSLRRAYANASTVRERFPSLEQLTVDMVFRDVQHIGTYSPQVRNLGASAKAFFSFPCPRTLCLHGGFDLDPIIQRSIEAGRVEMTGILLCEGWLHPTHTDDSRCRLELHYRVRLSYQVPASAQPRPRARA